MDQHTRTELEAAAFRRLLAHLDSRKDVQNIDMMNLTGFCRNCLSRWYQEAAEAQGLPSTKKRPAKQFTECPMTIGKRSINPMPAPRNWRISKRTNPPIKPPLQRPHPAGKSAFLLC